MIESLSALAEYVDPALRAALGAPTDLCRTPLDGLIVRYALAWLGQQALSELELGAALGELPADWATARLPAGLPALRQRLLADLPTVRREFAARLDEI